MAQRSESKDNDYTLSQIEKRQAEEIKQHKEMLREKEYKRQQMINNALDEGMRQRLNR